MTACVHANESSGMVDVVTSVNESNAQFKMATVVVNENAKEMTKEIGNNEKTMTRKMPEGIGIENTMTRTMHECIGIDVTEKAMVQSIGFEIEINKNENVDKKEMSFGNGYGDSDVSE